MTAVAVHRTVRCSPGRPLTSLVTGSRSARAQRATWWVRPPMTAWSKHTQYRTVLVVLLGAAQFHSLGAESARQPWTGRLSRGHIDLGAPLLAEQPTPRRPSKPLIRALVDCAFVLYLLLGLSMARPRCHPSALDWTCWTGRLRCHPCGLAQHLTGGVALSTG
jgi:hypothetical protein